MIQRETRQQKEQHTHNSHFGNGKERHEDRKDGKEINARRDEEMRIQLSSLMITREQQIESTTRETERKSMRDARLQRPLHKKEQRTLLMLCPHYSFVKSS
jgi:hypothetical protein